jgi:primosomal protein N' (replication factor Y)
MRLLRIDADTTSKKGDLEKLLFQFRTHKADVLIGTQMIAKGLDFPLVTLVGVLNADSGLSIPDFRASERSFQLITQVAGRAGRAALPGEVIIQTLMPNHTAIELAKTQDYERFFEEEMQVRKLFNFPPYLKMMKLVFSSTKEKAVRTQAEKIYAMLVQRLPSSFYIHPPHPSGYQKVKDVFRYQILLRGTSVLYCQPLFQEILRMSSSSVRITLDIDPSSTFF